MAISARGKGVTSHAGVVPAVEGEAERPRRIDRAGDREAARHGLRPANSAAVTAWLRVSRVTTSQDRQPADMVPIFAMQPGRIGAQIDIGVKSPERVGRVAIRPLDRRITQIGEFLRIALAAERTGDSHGRRPTKLYMENK